MASEYGRALMEEDDQRSDETVKRTQGNDDSDARANNPLDHVRFSAS